MTTRTSSWTQSVRLKDMTEPLTVVLLFQDNPCSHPVVILRDASFADVEGLVRYVYRGEVDVQPERLQSFLRTAEVLRIKGLADQNLSSSNEGIKKEVKVEERHRKAARSAIETARQQGVGNWSFFFSFEPRGIVNNEVLSYDWLQRLDAELQHHGGRGSSWVDAVKWGLASNFPISGVPVSSFESLGIAFLVSWQPRQVYSSTISAIPTGLASLATTTATTPPPSSSSAPTPPATTTTSSSYPSTAATADPI